MKISSNEWLKRYACYLSVGTTSGIDHQSVLNTACANQIRNNSRVTAFFFFPVNCVCDFGIVHVGPKYLRVGYLRPLSLIVQMGWSDFGQFCRLRAKIRALDSSVDLGLKSEPWTLDSSVDLGLKSEPWTVL